jgi:cation diffusion facilitator CzcD-associated flavoprotein CzcO
VDAFSSGYYFIMEQASGSQEFVMSRTDDSTVIIGAGPYGLSVAAHLRPAGRPVHVFGKTMELWKNMPSGLCLKSVWSASSLSDPAGAYTLERYIAETGTPRQEPIPQPFFLNYTDWFQRHAVPDVDAAYVCGLYADGRRFHLDLADGRSMKAGKVVVAVGIASFAYCPDFARNLPAEVVSHTSSLVDVTPFKGMRVVMVGNGQSALECAALLYEAGASVELISRHAVRWHSKMLYDYTGPARHIFYPPGDVGPPGINWLVAFPSFYRHLPEAIKDPLHRRSVLPGGAKWLRPRVEGRIRITENRHVIKAVAHGESVCLELSDGTQREADHLFLGTGYRPRLEKLTFIDPLLCQRILSRCGLPMLKEGFESSVPGLYFVGALAGDTFGPTCRFISGSKATARLVARHLTLAA